MVQWKVFEFQRLVDARGAALRALPHEELLAAAYQPTEHVEIRGRGARIGIIVEPRPDGSLRVVVQGFMPVCRLLPGIASVALDGFYKRPDGTVEPMPRDEFCEFD